MNLLVIGLNHRTAPVAVRERLAFRAPALGDATHALRESAGLLEAAILSTCNRVEIYALAGDAVTGSQAIRDFLHAHHQLADSVDAHLYELRDADSVRHLVAVAAGLDSMVVGETEILGQVKDAYRVAQQAGATGPVLNRLFQKTFAAAKQIRSTTAISRGSTSVASVAVDLAGQIFGHLAQCRVMVLGTGAMSEQAAKALHSRGALEIIVCSRTQERAQALAGQLQGRAIAYEQWPEVFPTVDIVISSTAAPHPIVTCEKLAPFMKARQYRPLFLIDIAVPRDVERACGELEAVYLYDIDDLQQIAEQNRAAREREVAICQELAGTHAARFLEWFADNHDSLRGRYPAVDPHRPGARPSTAAA